MNHLGMIAFGVVMIGLFGGAAILMGRTKRNDGSTHGGGIDGSRESIDYGDD